MIQSGSRIEDLNSMDKIAFLQQQLDELREMIRRQEAERAVRAAASSSTAHADPAAPARMGRIPSSRAIDTSAHTVSSSHPRVDTAASSSSTSTATYAASSSSSVAAPTTPARPRMTDVLAGANQLQLKRVKPGEGVASSFHASSQAHAAGGAGVTGRASTASTTGGGGGGGPLGDILKTALNGRFAALHQQMAAKRAAAASRSPGEDSVQTDDSDSIFGSPNRNTHFLDDEDDDGRGHQHSARSGGSRVSVGRHHSGAGRRMSSGATAASIIADTRRRSSRMGTGTGKVIDMPSVCEQGTGTGTGRASLAATGIVEVGDEPESEPTSRAVSPVAGQPGNRLSQGRSVTTISLSSPTAARSAPASSARAGSGASASAPDPASPVSGPSPSPFSGARMPAPAPNSHSGVVETAPTVVSPRFAQAGLAGIRSALRAPSADAGGGAPPRPAAFLSAIQGFNPRALRKALAATTPSADDSATSGAGAIGLAASHGRSASASSTASTGSRSSTAGPVNPGSLAAAIAAGASALRPRPAAVNTPVPGATPASSIKVASGPAAGTPIGGGFGGFGIGDIGRVQLRKTGRSLVDPPPTPTPTAAASAAGKA